jgi:hypothetical protein
LPKSPPTEPSCVKIAKIVLILGIASFAIAAVMAQRGFAANRAVTVRERLAGGIAKPIWQYSA